MRADLIVLGVILVAALGLGSVSDRADSADPRRVEGGWLISGDFHVHASPSEGTLPPAQLWHEARRRNLDVIAVTNHNQMIAARLGARLSRSRQLPLVLYGEEVTNPTAHVIALAVGWEIGW